LPLPVEVDEVLACYRVDGFGLDLGGERDRRSDLADVLDAGVTSREVVLHAATQPIRESPVEEIRDELHDLLAGERLRLAAPSSSSSHLLQRPSDVCACPVQRTPLIASLIESTAPDFSAVSPSSRGIGLRRVLGFGQ